MILPLAMAPEGALARIIEIRAGRRAMTRLADLGFTRGSVVRVLKSFGSGPLLLEVRGSRIALGRGLAMKLLVEVL
jgi:ferrous iron transport protein A